MTTRPRSRRGLLLKVALEAFARQGYDATGVAELADATGMSKAAVTYHFPTKDLILNALAEPLLDRLDEVLDRHSRRPSWPEGVHALLVDYLDVLLDCRTVAAWVDADKSLADGHEVGERLRRQNARAREALAGDDSDVARVRASAALSGLWRPLRTLPDLELEPHRQALVDKAMAGLRDPPQTGGQG